MLSMWFTLPVFQFSLQSSVNSSLSIRAIGLVALIMFLKLQGLRVRPDKSDRFSFPSGHAALSMHLARQTIISHRTMWALWAMWPWAVMTCISRVVERRHYMTDVLAGAIIGVCW